MNLNNPRVFVFCRPYLIPDFQENVAPLAGEFDFKFLTDGRRPGIRDTRERFYARLETATPPNGFSSEDELDVIARCRYLRNLPREQALKMLRSMASILQEELDQYQPQVVLAQVVDEYITHLLSEIARRRDIPYVGYFYSYFPGKSQVMLSSIGQPLNFREPLGDEIGEVYAKISPQTFRQNYKQQDTYTGFRHLKAILRYRIKQIVFQMLRWYEQDPLNYHYSCLPYIVERRTWHDLPSLSDFHQNWRNIIKRESDSVNQRPIVYFPLSYTPETTTDYWVEDKRFIDYENTVLNICQTLSAEFLIVVKEHVHMIGGRNTDFYRKLRDISSVVCVPPLEYSSEVVDYVDITLTGAGSTGVESYLRGKPIVSYCDRSYWFSSARATYIHLSELGRWSDLIKQKINVFAKPSENEKLDFVRNCIRSTMRIRKEGKAVPICNVDDLRSLLKTAILNNSINVEVLASHNAS